MDLDIQDTHLIVTIKNKEPLELIELTKALVSLGSQFNSYASANGEGREGREAKLYVKEIKTGSVIFDLVDIVQANAIPFAGHVSTIVKFAGYLKTAFNYFLKKEGEKPALSTTDYKEFAAIINPVAKDSGSQFNISTVINGNPTIYVNMTSLEANALQNIFKTEAKELNAPESLDGDKEKVLFYWDQAKSNLSANTGNRGVIESISNSPLKVIFNSDAIKEQMIKGETNPFTHAYIVDVNVSTIKSIPALYKILKVHDIIERPE